MRPVAEASASVPLCLSLIFLFSPVVCRPADAQTRPGERVRSLAEIRQQGVILQKWDISCGAAALATLLTYDLHDPVSERAVATAMLHRTDPVRVRTRGGFSLLNMQEYVESRGYEADGYGQLSFGDLVGLLPAIVPVQFHGYDHFVVVRQVQNGKVFFADPAYGRRSLWEGEFERTWKLKVAFVVSARRTSPPAVTVPLPESESVALPVSAAAAAAAQQTASSTDSEDDLAGALESALVQQAGRVLPRRTIEIEPEVYYFYDEPTTDRRRDNFGAAITTRLGLPGAMQAELYVPYVARDRWAGVGSSSGLGDVRIGVTKELVIERNSVPALLTFAQWRIPTGDINLNPPTGFGQNAVQYGLTVTKRQDPIVLFGNIWHTVNLSTARLASGARSLSGNVFGSRLGTFMAATPGMSLFYAVTLNSSTADRFNGERVEATDRLSGMIEFGTTTIIRRGVFLNTTTAIGFTPAAPKFVFSMSTPVRF